MPGFFLLLFLAATDASAVSCLPGVNQRLGRSGAVLIRADFPPRLGPTEGCRSPVSPPRVPAAALHPPSFLPLIRFGFGKAQPHRGWERQVCPPPRRVSAPALAIQHPALPWKQSPQRVVNDSQTLSNWGGETEAPQAPCPLPADSSRANPTFWGTLAPFPGLGWGISFSSTALSFLVNKALFCNLLLSTTFFLA